MRISELSVRRPVFATVLSMMPVIFGLVSLPRLSVREYPDIDRPTVSITTAYRGASAAIIETKITQIIEDSVAGIEGILKIESDSEDERSQVRIEFDVNRDVDAAANDVRDRVSRVMRGLPPVWMHPGDELYAQLRGPGRNMTVLATAWSDPANAGSGRDEPQLMVLRYGEGRVFHTTLGHDLAALSGVDFTVTFQRGAEWAASGRVTQPVPPDFPGPDTFRVRPGLATTPVRPPAPGPGRAEP